MALPALILTFLLDNAGQYLHPEFYNASWGFSSHHVWWQYLSGLTFSNELWWQSVPQGSMLPYWSLGYEVWYYAIFGAFWFGQGRLRFILPVLFGLIAGPKILLLFPIWLMGFAVYRLGKHKLSEWIGWSLLTASLFLFAALVANWGVFENTGMRYATGALFAIHICGIQIVSRHFSPVLLRAEKPVRWLAGLTFTLYLVHLPVAQFLTTVVPWPPYTAATRLTILLGTFLIVVLVSQVTEHRKTEWRAAVRAIFYRVGSMFVTTAGKSI